MRTEVTDSSPAKKVRQRPIGGFFPKWRATGRILSFGICALALALVFRIDSGAAFVGHLRDILFGPLAWLTAAFSSSWALVMFLEIVQSYQKITGFPWLASLSFAAAATSGIIGLHALLP